MKKIAVILTGRQSEGVRMAAGLSLLDDNVDIYLIDKDFNGRDLQIIEKHIEMVRSVGIGLYSNFFKEGFEFISNTDFGNKFSEYDYIIPY